MTALLQDPMGLFCLLYGQHFMDHRLDCAVFQKRPHFLYQPGEDLPLFLYGAFAEHTALQVDAFGEDRP